MSIKRKFQNWFYLDDEEETVEPRHKHEEERPAAVPMKPVQQRKQKHPTNQDTQQSARVVSLQSIKQSSKMILAEPRVYAEAQDISEHLKNKRTVVVNLQRIDRDQGIRIVDFLSGTVYALGGDIQRIGTDIFLCVPDNVEITGAISDYFEQ